MNTHRPALALCLASLATIASACAALPPDDGTDVAVDAIRDVRQTMSRVVIGRMYQHGEWTIPAADDYRPREFSNRDDRRVAYVCDALAPLEPTYVSGLVRIDSEETPSDAMITMFRRVKRCIRERVRSHPVHFDIVLNAVHYSDPHLVRSANAGADLLRQRLRTATDAFHPDAYFFDFFTVPFNNDEHPWYPDAIRDGMAWIHHNNMRVGGNVMGRHLPPGTDFAVLTSRNGLEEVRDIAQSLADEHVPMLMHIRNDPQIDGTEGLRWMHDDIDYRRGLLESHAEHQNDIHYSYMYPVFFPLDEHWHSYDAVADGNMLDRIGSLMDRYNAN